ncbi:HNH endonuclease [Mesorhizobium microcysteis]|uniref:HNH endonuclease n=1 Tax=Neoaquamicrobium microcysteis TaxID=2682781 RepID=A0A5D4H2V6_9HYPH|nr:HNH endonuclease [Mesorhizobium microcysteis]
MQLDQISDLHLAATRLLGAWWKYDRRNWCAYCGIPMRKRGAKGKPLPPNKATRDHIIPKAHKGGGVTIPACLGCNAAKGKLSLPEFLESKHFGTIRLKKHRKKWPIHDLWVVSVLAALKCAETSYEPAALHAVAEIKADHTR